MTISGSMDKLVEEEEKKPQYRVTKISEVVVPSRRVVLTVSWYF